MCQLSDLYRLTIADVNPAGDMLARAFYDDPQAVLYFPDSEERRKKLTHTFRFAVCYGVQNGEVYAPSPQLEGIAAWIPSDKHRTMIRVLRAGGLSTLMGVGWETLRKQLPIEDYIHGVLERDAPFPHWFLDPLGVDPDYQGQGHASTLLQAMNNRADAEQTPLYLYTSLERNVQMYQHFGYMVCSESTLPGMDVLHWSMVREPGTKS